MTCTQKVSHVLHGTFSTALGFLLLLLIVRIFHGRIRLDWLLSIVLIHLVVRLSRLLHGLWAAPLAASRGFLFYGELHQGSTVFCSQVGELDRQLGVLQDAIG